MVLPRLSRAVATAWRRLTARRRLRALFGSGAQARQSLVALALNSTTSLVAGAILGSITGTFEQLPGLLVLVPAAIGLRGNVFSALGNRLSTAIITGTLELSPRRHGVLGQNVTASLVLTVAMSALLAVLAKGVSVALGIAGSIPLVRLALISVVGGALASVVVLAATVGIAVAAVRFDWDLDNVTAPLVSTLGDVLTLPALWLATFLLAGRTVADVLGGVLLAGSAGALVWGLRSRATIVRRVVRESVPILVVALVLSTLSGLAIERRLTILTTYPALLVLVPAFISSAGALGGILSARLASKMHLGLVDPTAVPGPAARQDSRLVCGLAAPVFTLNAIGAHLVSGWLGERSPGLAAMLGVSWLGGVVVVAFVVAVGYYGTILSVRIGVDPDTYGIPIVTSSVDFVGALALLAAVVALGIVASA